MKKLTQIAGLAGVVLIGLGLFVGMVQQRLGTVVIAHLVAGSALAALGALSNLSEIREAMATRSARMGPQVIVQAALILIVMLFINIIVFKHDYIKDMTRRNLYTLSKATRSVARNLPGEVQAIAFFPGGGPIEARQRLLLYEADFPLFKLRFVDPDKNEDIARAEAVPPQPGILFKYKGHRVWVTNYEENDITNALIKVTRDIAPKVWFTTGHGEPAIDSEGPNGLGYLKKTIEQQGYVAQSVDLSTRKSIPMDVSMVAIVGPASLFTDHEIQLLDYYLGQGGNAMLFLDPVYGSGAISGLEAFIQPYGLTADWDLIFDHKSHLADDKTGVWLVATDMSDHPITSGLSEPRAVFYLARSLRTMPKLPGEVTVTPLVKSSPSSFARPIDPRTLSALSDQQADQYLARLMDGNKSASDVNGPFTLAFALSRRLGPTGWKADLPKANAEKKEMRLVVVGTSAICRNTSFYMPYNYELVMNSFNWLAGEKDLKYIRPPQRTGTRLNLDERQQDMILYVSVTILPEVFMIIGLAVWWRKR